MQTTLEMVEERLRHVEQEVTGIKQQVTELYLLRRRTNGASSTEAKQSVLTDKTALKAAFAQLRQTLSIEYAPIGAEALQQLMADAGLEETELSRGLIQMREE